MVWLGPPRSTELCGQAFPIEVIIRGAWRGVGQTEYEGSLVLPLVLGIVNAVAGVAYWRSARDAAPRAGTRVHQVGAAVMIALGSVTALGCLLRLLVTG
jgi:hypothetical protein